MKFRIMERRQTFKIQYSTWGLFWKTLQRPEDLDNKDFGGDRTFSSFEEAEKFLEQTKKDFDYWKIVKKYNN